MPDHILVFAEKPYQSRELAKSFKEVMPDKRVIFMNLISVVYPAFDYPKVDSVGNKVAPSEPVYDFSYLDNAAPMEMVEGEMKPVDLPLADVINQASELINAGESDYSGVTAFHLTAQHFFGPDYLEKMTVSTVNNDYFYTDPIKGLKERTPGLEGYEERLEYGLLKKHFDWNWNRNSFAIYTPILLELGVPEDKAMISKNALVMLDALNGQGNVKIGDVMDAMSRWKGTGKFYSDFDPGKLGSVASRFPILENLKDSGLIHETDDRPSTLIITQKGREFLAKLDPETLDPDLPYTMDNLFQLSLEEGKSAINQHLDHMFSRQVDFTASTKNTESPIEIPVWKKGDDTDKASDWRNAIFVRREPKLRMR